MKVKHYILGAAAMLFAVAANAQEPAVAVDSNFYIFLCFGQSNMEGQGTITAADRNVDERFLSMNTTDCDAANGNALYSWRKAVPPLARCGVGLGPVDYFGRLLLDSITPHNPDIRIGVVDVAVAGCGIELFSTVNDSDLEYKKTAADWMQGMIAAYGGRPYQRLVDAAREAQKSGVIKGILLHQGESNNGSQAWPGQVAAIYDSLISQLKLKAEDVPLLVGETVTSEVGGACGWHNTVVAQMPDTVKNAYVVSAKNLEGKSDGLHFTDNSYRVLGKRYAKQWLRSAGYVVNELPEIIVDTTIECCGSYKWNGKEYKSSQTLKHTFVQPQDQDSIVTIHLVVKKSYKITLDPVTAETEYVWPVDGKTYTESDWLTCNYTTVDGCDSVIICKLTIGATAIDEDAANERITIYPNPTTNMLNISIPTCATGTGRIAIFTTAGIEVFSSDFVSEFESLDISNWNNGIYLLQITDSDGNVWNGKFLKTSK